MASLAKLTAQRVTIQVPIDDETVSVTYRPRAYSEELEEALRAAQDDERGAAMVREAFAAIVESWDLRWDEADPEPIPVTREGLRAVPSEVLGALLAKIGDDRAPDPKAKRSSPGR